MTCAHRQRGAAAGSLLLCWLSVLVIADATGRLEQQERRRREQLAVLTARLGGGGAMSAGALTALDGLFARRLATVAVAGGELLTFADPVAEGNP